MPSPAEATPQPQLPGLASGHCSAGDHRAQLPPAATPVLLSGTVPRWGTSRSLFPLPWRTACHLSRSFYACMFPHFPQCHSTQMGLGFSPNRLRTDFLPVRAGYCLFRVGYQFAARRPETWCQQTRGSSAAHDVYCFVSLWLTEKLNNCRLRLLRQQTPRADWKNLVYIKIPRHNFQTLAPKVGVLKHLKASMVFICQLHQFNTGTLLQATPGVLQCFFFSLRF